MGRNDVIKFKRGTAADWTSLNLVLRVGEPGFETDTGKLKIGDGTTAWNSLVYLTDVEGAPVTIENVDDRVSELLAAGPFIGLEYDDDGGILTISGTGIGPSGHNHVLNDIVDFDGSLTTSLVGKSGIGITYDSVNDELVVVYTGVTGGPTELDQLTDVSINLPQVGQVLKYDGNDWINGIDNSGGSISSPVVIDSITIEDNVVRNNNTVTSEKDLVLKPYTGGSLVTTNNAFTNPFTVPSGTRGWYAIDLQQFRTEVHQIAAGNYSCIPGGSNNTASGDHSYCMGAGNTVFADHGGILAGLNNTIQINSDNSVICGGTVNIIQSGSTGGVIVGGQNNVLASGSLDSCIINGDYHKADANYSTIVGGRYGLATMYGEIAHATQPQAAQNRGGIQHSVVLASSRQSSGSKEELFLDGSSNSERITIPLDTSWHFDINVTAKGYGTSDAGWWKFTGGIVNTGGTVSQIGTVTQLGYGINGTNFTQNDITISADNTNKSLKIEATDPGGFATYYSATVNITQCKLST
jgi:hypothetical protein